MVSEWMEHGNINEFVKKHQRVNPLQLVSCSSLFECKAFYNHSIQLVDAASGLDYMHGLNMVHGDLKGV